MTDLQTFSLSPLIWGSSGVLSLTIMAAYALATRPTVTLGMAVTSIFGCLVAGPIGVVTITVICFSEWAKSPSGERVIWPPERRR